MTSFKRLRFISLRHGQNVLFFANLFDVVIRQA